MIYKKVCQHAPILFTINFLDLLAGVGVNNNNDLAEELIARQTSLTQILRILCLQSVLNGGLRQKQYDFFCREIIQTYGCEHLLTIRNLAKSGLFYPQGSGRNPYPQLRKYLQLVVDDFGPPDAPKDLSYTYRGYAPISARLVQCVIRPEGRPFPGGGYNLAGWKGYEDVIRLVNGATIEETQHDEEAIGRAPGIRLYIIQYLYSLQVRYEKVLVQHWSFLLEDAPMPKSLPSDF